MLGLIYFLHCGDPVSPTCTAFGRHMGLLKTDKFHNHIHYLHPTGSEAFWILCILSGTTRILLLQGSSDSNQIWSA